ncbi:MAG: caspase family protein, partial [Thermodesulfovibrionia bacterium]|nr:caspase family protein [Thermodesulfovibrionia bacterium]
MNNSWKHIVILLAPFILFACGTTRHVEKKPLSKFTGITLAKRIEKKDTKGIPSEATNTFTTQDTEVVAHLRFENMAGKHNLRWEWYDPEGNLYYSTGDYPVKASRGKYMSEATVWHSLSIRGDKAENHPGKWEVKVYLDNSLLEAKRFDLTALAGIDDLPDTGQRPYPKDWGIIIGIEDYASLPSVDYARKDALIVREYFNKMLGVPEENIITLIDGDATKARIEGYLRKYLPENIGKDTTLYVYFAGHGIPDMERGDPYLVPYDGDTRFIAQTGYRLKTFYNDLDNLGTGKVYVFLDSCFSGVASRAAEMLTKGQRPALIHVEDVSIDSDKLVALSASTAGQTSNAHPEVQHGLFTYYLLRALRGEADENEDRWVSVKEAY